ncbi:MULTISPECIES: TetR/AcrR family transcriptional regulator [Nocardiopsis]|jgi:AcrR family transcriptional regulator|uniref:TetR/AcrR family transcriptional regulator n=2 Tax=Nocardiopsis alba TaxID=53437 RepID=A0A7K2IWL8_9ACTN|nr:MULTISPECIES: TetR/AcrR family transcriptional regulator [Nocardiopsis]AFR09608.1 putative regulatory protein TetR [Nocardiopsis alba ATCC BAA-2165]MEC3892288.1 TetR/AcrR family transcriptional regulator [Nocardiopsis sp. LDBS1602]MYR34349.1 TetR/AcrR family transcriptional regulator [Nocardiopsis alba]
MTADLSPHSLRTTAPVLDCAARLFAEHGSRGLPMSALTHRIAAETSTDGAALRRAFPTRFDLTYAIVLRATRERVNDQLTTDVPDSPATRRMADLVRRHVASGWRHRDAVALGRELLPTLRAIHPVRHREISGLHRLFRDHVREIVLAGIREGRFEITDPGRAADKVLETFDSLLHWYDPEAGLSIADLGDVYVDLVIHHQLGHPR